MADLQAVTRGQAQERESVCASNRKSFPHPSDGRAFCVLLVGIPSGLARYPVETADSLTGNPLVPTLMGRQDGAKNCRECCREFRIRQS